MIELERRLALGIIVPVSLELVILADNDLIPVSISTCLRSTPPQPVICIVPTSWLAPGNFTVASCFSLYRWKAGAREGMMSGVSAVRALISVFQRKCFSRPLSHGIARRRWRDRSESVRCEEAHIGQGRGRFTGHDIGELRRKLAYHITTRGINMFTKATLAYLAWRGTLDERGCDLNGGSRSHED